MDQDFLKKLAVLLMSYGTQGLDAFKAVALDKSLTERAQGWAFAMRRDAGPKPEFRVVIVLCAENTGSDALYATASDWVLTLRTAIRQAMREHEIDPDRGDRANHPMVPWLLRQWSGLGTVVR